METLYPNDNKTNSFKSEVLKIFPNANVEKLYSRNAFRICRTYSVSMLEELGEGRTEDEAWEDACKKCNEAFRTDSDLQRGLGGLLCA